MADPIAEFTDEWPVGDKCEEDGCVIHYSPSGRTRPIWCKGADEEHIEERKGSHYVYCGRYNRYVLIYQP